MTEQRIHPFEKAGLGRAPFRFVGCFEDRGPHRHVDPKTGVTVECGAPGQPMGTCDYCGTGIAICCRIKSADGKSFIVGSDCVRKTHDPGAKVLTDMEVQHKRMMKEAKARRDHDRIEAAYKMLDGEQGEAIALALNAKPHPHPRMAKEGKTYLDYLIWMFANAGTRGKLQVARVIEKTSKEIGT